MVSSSIKDTLFVSLAQEMIFLREAILDLSKRFDQIVDDQYSHMYSNGEVDIQDITAVDILDITADTKGAIENNFDNVLIEKETYPNEGDGSIGDVSSLHLYGSLYDADKNVSSELYQSVDLQTHDSTATDNHPIVSQVELAYQSLLTDVFKYFCADKLERSTEFTHVMNNRKAVYYGQYPYSYGNTVHTPQDISKNTYLEKLLNYVDIVFPDLEFNSAMVHLYENGSDFMPHHSDDEANISEGSTILTISLGGSRNFEFNDKSSGLSVENLVLPHGSCLLMTKRSQNFFTHSIVECESAEKRLSVTLRMITPQSNSVPTLLGSEHTHYCSLAELMDNTLSEWDEKSDHNQTGSDHQFPNSLQHEHDCLQDNSVPDYVLSDSLQCGYQPSQATKPISPAVKKQSAVHQKTAETATAKESINTIYIGSSMFRHLNAELLSSATQTSKVFFFPGADSKQMMQRLFSDPEFKKLEKNNVERIVLITGTNYVDSIYNNELPFDAAVDGIKNLANRLWSTFMHAQFYFLNILPRNVTWKNNIVMELNGVIREICRVHGSIFIDTEVENKLFTDNMQRRKNKFFAVGHDNVHLNKTGVARLARHLKYATHRCFTFT